MPEPTSEQQQPDQQQPTQVVEETPRQELYQKYYDKETPKEDPKPVETPPDYKAMFEQLTAEIASLKEKITPPTAPPPAPEKDWFALLQEGRRTEAEEALKNTLAAGTKETIAKEVLAQTLEAARTEREIEEFNFHTRNANPDLLDVEEFITLKASQKLNAIQPTIKTSKEFITAYKNSVNEAITEIRKLLQRTRAAAKDEANTVRRTVLYNTPVRPNDINSQREQPDPNKSETPDISPQSYIEERQTRYRANSNLR